MFWIIVIALGLVVGWLVIGLLEESPGCGCLVILALVAGLLLYVAF